MKPLRINGGGVSPLRNAQQKQMNRSKGTEGVDKDFKNMLTDYISEVDSLQGKADKALQDFATGKVDNIHRLVVATSEAEMSFRLMMKARNKLVEAYNEIMRMKV